MEIALKIILALLFPLSLTILAILVNTAIKYFRRLVNTPLVRDQAELEIEAWHAARKNEYQHDYNVYRSAKHKRLHFEEMSPDLDDYDEAARHQDLLMIEAGALSYLCDHFPDETRQLVNELKLVLEKIQYDVKY